MRDGKPSRSIWQGEGASTPARRPWQGAQTIHFLGCALSRLRFAGSAEDSYRRNGVWVMTACAAVLVLSLMSLAAGRSDVADAAMRGDAAAVRTLVAEKADVNATQPDGATALHW